MLNPLVSVIMCAYNTKSEYLEESIKSILTQTYNNIELIIIDDFSDVPVNVDSYNDKRIIVLRNNRNLGAGMSRNKAISASKGKYIIIMDSDDISLPNRIETQVKFMEEHLDTGIAGSWFKFFGEKNHIVKTCLLTMDEYRCHLLFNNSPTLLNSSTIIRKDLLTKNKLRFGDMRYAEDYMLWVKAAAISQIDIIPEVLVLYRCHNAQLSNKKKDEFVYNKKTVYKYQFNCIGAEIDNKSLDNFYNANNREKYNEKLYKKLLDFTLLKNFESKYFPINAFKKIVDENWYMMIRKIKNPFKLFLLLFLDKATRSFVLKSIKQRFKHCY